MDYFQQRHKKEEGAVLIVSLIMLVLLTLIGLESIESTLVEEKLAYHYKDKGISFQDAEKALLKLNSIFFLVSR